MVHPAPRRRSFFQSELWLHLALIAVALFSVLPLWWAGVSSLKDSPRVFRDLSPFSWEALLPTDPSLDAYIALFTKTNFGRAMANSAFIVIATIAGGLVVNGLAGFAFAKFRFRGKEALFLLVLITFMVPFEVIAIPLYILIQTLGWVNTYYALIIPAIPNGLVIFLFRQLYASIPDDLIESAKIDGASWPTILWRIIVPLSKPASITASLIIFVYQWEVFLWPLIAANTPDLMTIQVALSLFQQEYQTLWDRLFAGIIVSVLVPLLVLIPLQKYYVQGIATTGMKE